MILMCWKAWAEVTRFKMFKKRTLRMTNLMLGGFSIGVQLYKMVGKAKKGKTFQLHAVTNDELITESAMIDQDTGVQLDYTCFELLSEVLHSLRRHAEAMQGLEFTIDFTSSSA